MLQIIDYKTTKTNVLVGFKKYNFVVYGEMGIQDGYTKEQYLQKLYELCKPSIDYETELYIRGYPNSIITDKKGESFTPENPKPVKLKVDFDNLTGVVLDQYDDIYFTGGFMFTIEGTDRVQIRDNKIIEDAVEECEEYLIVAKWGDLEKKQKRTIYPSISSKINQLEQQVLEMQDYIIEREYLGLLEKGGM